MTIDKKTKEQIERVGRAIYESLKGKVVEVPYLSYFLGDDSQEHEGPFLVRVLDTDSDDLDRWNHEYYDPNWNVEPLPGQDIPSEARNFWASGVSCNSEPKDGALPPDRKSVV